MIGIGTAIGAIVSFATTAVQTLSAIGLAATGIKTVISVITAVCKALGIIPPDKSPEEFGDQALQAEEAGIVPQNFEKFSDYIKEVEKFQVDPEKSAKITSEAKQMKAFELSAGGMFERFGALAGDFINIVEKNPEFFGGNVGPELAKFVSVGDNLKDFVAVINETEKNVDKYDAMLKSVAEIYKEANPGTTIEDAQNAVLDI